MKLLKYPKDLTEHSTDYMMLTAHEYRTNSVILGSDVSADSWETRNSSLPPQRGSTIVLFMPRSTPSVSNSNSWSEERAPGAIGNIRRNLGVGATSFIDKFGGNQTGGGIQDILDQLKNLNKAGAAAKQGLTQAVADGLGFNASSLLAMSRGKIYNPNVEMIYQGPQVRAFDFTYDFIPKSYDEGRVANDIIREFKKWSSPEIAEEKTMYSIPLIWSIKYMTNKNQNKHMNAFKRCVLTSVATQANSQLDYHMSYNSVVGGEAGMPISTTLSLSFTEVDVITREDHEVNESGSYQGF